MTHRITRRSFLGGLGAAGAAGALGGLGLSPLARAQSADGPRFLIVLGAGGGASIVDGPLAIAASKSLEAERLNTFPDDMLVRIPDAPFRAIDTRREELGPIPVSFTANQSDFVRAHHRDMMVSTWTRTSVNHAIGQRRSVTGNEAWLGRTLQECVAMQYGADFPLPNVHLTSGSGFTDRGTDGSLPPGCYGEVVVDPKLWPLSLDGARGIDGAPSKGLLDRARALRDDRLDPRSRFGEVFGESPRLKHWQRIRGEQRRLIESLGLIDKLMFTPESAAHPLAAFGLESSPDGQRVRDAFPNYDQDPLEAQAALAFLLIKHRVSCTVTLGPTGSFVFVGGEGNGGGGRRGLPDDSVANPPIAFDFSHQAHRSVQALMWHRMYRVMDGLIGLLKAEAFAGGQSLWDRSMIYMATDFGRDKKRPDGADEWGTGHDLDNGVLVVSPLANGGRILGEVDPDTGRTYGFDPQTGEPVRGSHMEERQIYAGILHAMGVDTSGSGLPDMRAMRRNA